FLWSASPARYTPGRRQKPDVVGISSERWKSATTASEAQQIMRNNRFDVAPVAECGGVSTHFQTRSPGNFNGSPERKTIYPPDVIPYTTPLRYVICKFASESRSFYFLDDGERIVGLISVANLNCRQVKTYLHELLCGLEMSLC